MASPMAEMRMRQLTIGNAERTDGVVDGARHRRRRSHIAALASALLAEDGVRRRRALGHDLDLWTPHAMRAAGNPLDSASSICPARRDEFLKQRRADAVGDTAEGHALTMCGLMIVPQSWPMT